MSDSNRSCQLPPVSCDSVMTMTEQSKTIRDPAKARAARTFNKHSRWAEEMREAGWIVAPPAPEGGNVIRCRCGSDMDRGVLIDTPEGEVGEVYAAPEIHPDRDDYEDDNPLNTRGEWEQVRFVCGRGHTGSLVTADHKGQQRFALFGSAVLQ